jgi:hypothetical protein
MTSRPIATRVKPAWLLGRFNSMTFTLRLCCWQKWFMRSVVGRHFSLPFDSFWCIRQHRILANQRSLIRLDRLFLRKERTEAVVVALSISECTPRAAFVIEMYAFDAGFAVAANTVMTTCFFFGYDPKVYTTTIQTVVIEEDDFKARCRRHDFAMEIGKPILSIDFSMSYSVALLAAAFGPVAPAELREKSEIVVVNKSKLILG